MANKNVDFSGHHTTNEAADILRQVLASLQEKGYDPIRQLVGYLISDDPSYITNYKNARSIICRLERDELLEEILREYFNNI